MIVLSAFGKKGYIYAAFNMAVSIKAHNPKLEVCLLFDPSIFHSLTEKELSIFDKLVPLDDNDFKTLGRIDPGKLKTNFYPYLPYEENLILDVDGVCLQDLQTLISHLQTLPGWFYTDVMGKGKKEDSISYMLWASNNDIWERFGLKEDQDAVSVQTSFMWVKKGKEAKAFFKKLKSNYDKGMGEHRVQLWGGTLPDELFYTGTLGQLDLNPDPGLKPVFFGNYYYEKTMSDLHKEFYVMSLYGNGEGRTETKLRYLEYYDRIMTGYARGLGHQHIYKRPYIMADKHCNNR